MVSSLSRLPASITRIQSGVLSAKYHDSQIRSDGRDLRVCPTGVKVPKDAGLRQQPTDHVAVDVRQAVVAALELEGETGVVDPQAVQDRRVQVVDVHWVPRDVVAEVVRLAVGD